MLLLMIASSASAQRLDPMRPNQAWSIAPEAQWRDEVLPAIESQQAVAPVDPEASQYVTVLGNRLAYAAPGPTVFRCRFVLYDDNVGLRVPGFGLLKGTHRVNALPGGILVVPLSLFAVTADEAEFSAALARGIGHVALRHFQRTALRASLAGPWQPLPETSIFSRSFEGEADRAAVEILARTGFNPEAVVRYIRNGRASFDTSDARARVVQPTISKLPPRTYGPDDSLQFDALKARLGEAQLKL